jgi:hypothetical protein
MTGTHRLAARLVAFGLLALAASARAHPLAPSLLEIEERVPGEARVRWKTPARRVPGSALDPVLPAGCAPTGRPATEADPVQVVRTWTVRCGAGGLVGQPVAVTGIAESRADVLLHVRLADGRRFLTVLRPDRPRFVVPARAQAGEVLASYLRLGVTHILAGPDHLLFVLGLVLLVGARRRALLGTVSAFTAGHSVTLALAALGFVHVPPAPVEALIALSILVVGVELAREGPPGERRRPWALAFGFGLLHGLGFAGALAEVGLPAGDVPLALLAFNLGIEAGQLGFVAAVLLVRPALAPLLARLPARAGRLPAYVVGSLAAYWLFERLAASVPVWMRAAGG